MFDINYYNIYIYNLFYLIKIFNLKYTWININNEQFYEGVNLSYSYDFSLLENSWKNKILLAEDILKNGMYTPIFYYQFNNKKYIILGKHRIYSLILYNKIKPINKEFLFIELPHTEKKYLSNFLFFYWDNTYPLIKTKIFSSFQLINLLIVTGDLLSKYLQLNKTIPSKIFNNKNNFEKWIQQQEFNINGKILCSN